MSARLLALRGRIGGDVQGSRGTFPGPGHSPRDRSLSLWDVGSRVVAHSFAGDDLSAVREHLATNGVELATVRDMTQAERRAYNKARREVEEAAGIAAARKQQFALTLWGRVEEIKAEAAAYLRGRGLTAPDDADLGYLPDAPRGYEAGRASPAMIGVIVDPYDTPQGVHVTLLPDKFRMMMGRQRGGCVRLSAPRQTLAIAEGIETALSYTALTGTPCWAALSALGVEQWRPPNGVHRIVIAADGDDAGRLAAQRLHAVARAFARVEIDAAPDGLDWNDVLRGRG